MSVPQDQRGAYRSRIAEGLRAALVANAGVAVSVLCLLAYPYGSAIRPTWLGGLLLVFLLAPVVGVWACVRAMLAAGRGRRRLCWVIMAANLAAFPLAVFLLGLVVWLNNLTLID
jgi:hypothetical protein